MRAFYNIQAYHFVSSAFTGNAVPAGGQACHYIPEGC